MTDLDDSAHASLDRVRAHLSEPVAFRTFEVRRKRVERLHKIADLP